MRPGLRPASRSKMTSKSALTVARYSPSVALHAIVEWEVPYGSEYDVSAEEAHKINVGRIITDIRRRSPWTSEEY